MVVEEEDADGRYGSRRIVGVGHTVNVPPLRPGAAVADVFTSGTFAPGLTPSAGDRGDYEPEPSGWGVTAQAVLSASAVRRSRGGSSSWPRAPSVHNTQPWGWRVDGNEMGLCADTARRLLVEDPLDATP